MEAQRGRTAPAVADSQPIVVSPWSPFRHATFTVLWTATVIANVGTWMYNAASGWLMTSLNADPLIVSMVQVATSLPMFLFALPAGALADIIDKRRFLIAIEGATTVVAAIIAALVWLSLVTPSTLLLFTFLLGAGAALTATLVTPAAHSDENVVKAKLREVTAMMQRIPLWVRSAPEWLRSELGVNS